MLKNETNWGTINELKNVENEQGRATMIEVTRGTSLQPPLEIEGRSYSSNSKLSQIDANKNFQITK